MIENQRRQSTAGLSPDYLLYSLIGYICYALYTGALYFNSGIQEAYRIAHAGSAPDVQLSDFLFAGHAVAATLYTIYQCVAYDKQQQQELSPVAIGTAAVVTTSVLGYTSHLSNTCDPSDCATWLPLLSYLGCVKIAMTLVKYTPQALMNWKRRSTQGWEINNVLLDLSGGLLSFLQIGWDAAARHDLSVITGNPAKLGISAISIGFDLLFILQHYVLYPATRSVAPVSISSTGDSSSSSNSALKAAPQAGPVVAAAAVASKARQLRRLLKQ
jgi:LCT (Lysosomal Cystine Transporter) family transporter